MCLIGINVIFASLGNLTTMNGFEELLGPIVASALYIFLAIYSFNGLKY